MKRKAITIVVFMLTLVLVLSGCRPKEKPILRLGSGGEYPPFNYIQNGQFMGIDAEIARRIADKLGMELKVTQMPFESLFPSLASNKIDMAIAAISITEDRKQFLDFSAPYYVTNQAIIAPADSKIQINRLEDLGKYILGCQDETTGAEYIKTNLVDKDLMPRKNYRIYSTAVESLGELLSGKVDLLIIDDTAALGYARQKPLRTVFTINTNEQYAIAMQKGKLLNEKINQAMKEMIADGEVKAIISSNIK